VEGYIRLKKKNFPYQISGEYLLGNSEEIQTPKGLFYYGEVGLHLSYYIGIYKGGRNESFLYRGHKTQWFDYDLLSASEITYLPLPQYTFASFLRKAK
jgi:hypothetical protein